MENLSVISRNPSVIYIGAENIDEDRIDGEFYNYKYLENEIKLKKSGIKIKVLNDVIERMNSPIGWQGIPSSSYLPHGLGVPLIRVQNVSDLILDEESLIGVEESIYDEQPAIQAQANDIIITRVGTIGRVCRIPEKINRIAMGQNLTRIKLNETLVESGFMLAYMSSKFCQIQMERYAYGGVQASLTNKNIKQLLVPIPSPEIQKYIGDKVRKAEELREEAKRLKKEAEEIIYKKLGNIVLEDEKNYTANYIREEDIFERIDSEYYKEKYFRLQKQLKSKGFSLKTLDELCDSNIFNGRTYKTTNNKRKYMNIGVGELGDWFILANGDKYIDENINTNYLLDRYSIIWGNSAHLAKYIGEKVNINLETNSYVPTTEITCIKPNLDKINPYYLFLYMKSNWGYYQVQRTVKGMTAHSYPEDVSKIIVPILDFSFEELNVMKSAVELGYRYTKESKQLIQEAKQDVEDLIEGNFDMSKVRANS